MAAVDPSGTLVYYEKMDNTQTGSATVAIEKARTAAMFKSPTKAFEDAVAGGGSCLRALPVPGISDHDGICTQAAAEALKW